MSAPRVRVTLEGTPIQSVATAEVLRIRLDYGSEGSGPLVLIDRRWRGVTVEDLPPAWEWSEGDVVAGERIVYRRDESGVWVGVGPHSAPGLTFTLSDEQVSESAGKPEGYDVLRYAKGAE